MNPTLDEEIRKIAEGCATNAWIRGSPIWSMAKDEIESAIRAGIEAWKRQEPSDEMIHAARTCGIWADGESKKNTHKAEINRICRAVYHAMMSASLRTSETTGEG